LKNIVFGKIKNKIPVRQPINTIPGLNYKQCAVKCVKENHKGFVMDTAEGCKLYDDVSVLEKAENTATFVPLRFTGKNLEISNKQ
jgi:hypothetical protein